MRDRAVGGNIIDNSHHAVVAAIFCIAGALPKEGVDDRTIGIENNSEGFISRGRLNIRRHIDRAIGSDRYIAAADIFAEAAPDNDIYSSRWYTAPRRSSGLQHREQQCVKSGSSKRSGVRVIQNRSIFPMDRLPLDRRIEIAGTGNPARATGKSRLNNGKACKQRQESEAAGEHASIPP